MIRAALLALALALALPASSLGWVAQNPTAVAAGTEQVLLSTSTSTIVANRFLATGLTAVVAATDTPFGVFPVAGTINGMIVRTHVTPTTTTAWTATLRINAVDVAMSCTLNLGNSGKCTASGTIPIVPGDSGAVVVRISSGAPPATFVAASLLFQPTAATDRMIMAHGTPMVGTGGVTNAVNAFSSYNANGTPTSRLGGVFPVSGTVDRLYALTLAAPTAGKSFAYTIGKNSVTTALTCTIADAAVKCSACASGCDTTTAATISITGASGSVAGDVLQFQSLPTGAPAIATTGFGARFVPAIADTFPLMLSYAAAPTGTANAVSYYSMTGTGINAPEAQVQNVTHAMTVTSMSVKLNGAPGAAASGKSYTVKLRKNGVDVSSGCAVVETATANTCAVSPAVTFADGDLASLSFTASAVAPTTGLVSVGLLASRPAALRASR
jgi:hypothetical protein